jgi:hypothetical protein
MALETNNNITIDTSSYDTSSYVRYETYTPTPSYWDRIHSTLAAFRSAFESIYQRIRNYSFYQRIRNYSFWKVRNVEVQTPKVTLPQILIQHKSKILNLIQESLSDEKTLKKQRFEVESNGLLIKSKDIPYLELLEISLDNNNSQDPQIQAITGPMASAYALICQELNLPPTQLEFEPETASSSDNGTSITKTIMFNILEITSPYGAPLKKSISQGSVQVQVIIPKKNPEKLTVNLSEIKPNPLLKNTRLSPDQLQTILNPPFDILKKSSTSNSDSESTE